MVKNVVENGKRVKFNLILKVKNVSNIFSDEVIKEERVLNMIPSINDLISTFEEMTESEATSITMSSDLFYLMQDALDKEYPNESHYRDTCKFKGISVKGGCSLKGCEVVISSWKESDVIVGS